MNLSKIRIVQTFQASRFQALNLWSDFRWDYYGSFTAIIGCLLMSLKLSMFYGFVFFLVSNMCWMIFGFKQKLNSMIYMQVAFTFSSILGIYNWY